MKIQKGKKLMSSLKPGKHFENKTYEVVKGLNPNNKVQKNVYIKGKLSKVGRQVDVKLVEANDFDFLALECKDLKNPIDVPKVEAWVTKLKDIGAKRGGIVSNTPFTPGAINMASELNIDLLNLVDTSDEKIKTKLFADGLASEIGLEWWSLEIASSDSVPIVLSVDPKEYKFLNKGKIVLAHEVFKALWNEGGSLMEVPESYTYTITDLSDIKIVDLKGQIATLDKLAFHYKVGENYYQGHIGILETSGLYNVKDHTFQTKSLKTERLDASDLSKLWRPITEEEFNKLKHNVTFQLGVKTIYL